MTTAFQSWGRVVRASHEIKHPRFRDEIASLMTSPVGAGSLAVGLGRSYGDSCLNPGGRLIAMTALDRLIALDTQAGRVRAESGLSISHLLQRIVPKGWFLATTPGTRFVTLGGAVANDVHGKNHHVAGSFGCSVAGIELVRSDRGSLKLLASEGSPLFSATVGGLGLTGVMTTLDVDLVPIESAYLDVERIAFGNVGEFLALAAASTGTHEHTVAWMDCASGGANLGRGIFQRANWCSDGELAAHDDEGGLSVQMDAPSFTLNPVTVRVFNGFYYRMQKGGAARRRVHYAPFFYPLDSIRAWNRIYGGAGLYQYQCAIPLSQAGVAMPELVRMIAKSGSGSFLAVIKTLGPKRSPGMLAFARESVTLALDFPNRGQRTLDLLATLDCVVQAAGGWLYPAKDGRMPAALFQQGFPQWQEFAGHVDPALSSAFWRRVSAALD
ncbi:MAG: FAD-binding oxidoreductase [Hyphomicrobiaceae bacterium]